MQNPNLYLWPFLLAIILSFVFMRLLIGLGRKWKLFDRAKGRKRHIGNISRLGGLGIIVAFWSAILFSGSLEFDRMKIALMVCSAAIFFFGLWDDIRELSWKKQLAFQILIALVMVLAGLGVDYIANPLGGREFRLDGLFLAGYPVPGSVFVILWVVGFMNVVNWLDGMDGLAGGVGAIAAFTLFFLSTSELVNQPPLGVVAIALAGALLGFLAFNYHPARIFMGSSGSLFLGFMLSVLAIFSGGKIATVFLVMGFPILDAFWVIVRRCREGRSIFQGDRSHFFHYLADERKWPVGRIVLSIYLLSAIFALAALFLEGVYKFVALVTLVLAAPLFLGKRPSGF